MTVLGLDLSLRATGVCVLSGTKPEIATFLLKRESGKGVEFSINRLLSIANEIIDITKRYSVTSIIIEAPAQNQKWQAAAIGELHGVVKSEIYKQTGIVPFVEQATKLRKSVIGTIPSKRSKTKDKDGKVKNSIDYGVIKGKREGTTKKATIKDIIEHRLKESGLSFPSQDEMDAYVAARFAWDHLVNQIGD